MFSKKNPPPETSGAPTYLGGGMKIDGKITGRKPIWMDGEVQGTIDCESEVVIGPSAKVQATIHAATIKVNGHIEGDLYASGRVEVLSQGRIQGNITNLPGSLIIHEGGVMEGQCLIASDNEIRKLMPEWNNQEPVQDKNSEKKIDLDLSAKGKDSTEVSDPDTGKQGLKAEK